MRVLRSTYLFPKLPNLKVMSLPSASAASADASVRGVMSKDSKNKGGRPYGSRAAAAAAQCLQDRSKTMTPPTHC